MSRRCTEVISQIVKAIDRELQRVRSESERPLSLLDVGCWDGENTERYRAILGGPARGIEVFADQVRKARDRGIEIADIDLESGRFPWPDGSVDVVVVNQVFEHLKNVWLPMTEIARVLSPGGIMVFSVPNLASLHNRVMLALGLQPSSIRTFGPHIRGFTYRQAKHFVEFGDYFRVTRAVGVGFYPFPAAGSQWFANLWVSASHTPILVAKRIAPAAGIGEQTFYTT
jgi:SAM-dependent methyltransferase